MRALGSPDDCGANSRGELLRNSRLRRQAVARLCRFRIGKHRRGQSCRRGFGRARRTARRDQRRRMACRLRPRSGAAIVRIPPEIQPARATFGVVVGALLTILEQRRLSARGGTLDRKRRLSVAPASRRTLTQRQHRRTPCLGLGRPARAVPGRHADWRDGGGTLEGPDQSERKAGGFRVGATEREPQRSGRLGLPQPTDHATRGGRAAAAWL